MIPPPVSPECVLEGRARGTRGKLGPVREGLTLLARRPVGGTRGRRGRGPGREGLWGPFPRSWTPPSAEPCVGCSELPARCSASPHSLLLSRPPSAQRPVSCLQSSSRSETDGRVCLVNVALPLGGSHSGPEPSPLSDEAAPRPWRPEQRPVTFLDALGCGSCQVPRARLSSTWLSLGNRALRPGGGRGGDASGTTLPPRSRRG